MSNSLDLISKHKSKKTSEKYAGSKSTAALNCLKIREYGD